MDCAPTPPRSAQAAAQVARAEAESAAAALASGAIAAERSAFEERLTAARAEARDQALADARGDERVADLARADRLLASVRSLDDASSLSDALDALARAAQLEAGRAVVVLVRGDQLRGWAQAGFDDAVPDVRALTLPLADSGLLATAVSTGAPASSGRRLADRARAADTRRRRSTRHRRADHWLTAASSPWCTPTMAATRRGKCPAHGPNMSSCWRAMPRGVSRR